MVHGWAGGWQPRPVEGASLKSSDYYWPEPVALRATGQVSTLTELE